MRGIAESLAELNNWVYGRSQSIIEKDLRDTISSLNPEQINRLQDGFLNRYQGKYKSNLYAAIVDNPNLSESTKDFVKHYLQPADKRTPDGDIKRLVHIALRAENAEQRIQMFAEVMKNASPEARKEFFASGGKNELRKHFSGRDLQHAFNYAAAGELTERTQIQENTSSIAHAFSHKPGIEHAIKSMKNEDRQKFTEGKALAAQPHEWSELSPEQRKAIDHYLNIHQALSQASNSTDVIVWENMIAHPEGSFIQSLAKHRGNLFNSSSAEIATDIESLNEKDWDGCKQHPEFRDEFEQILKTFGKSPQEIKELLSMYDQKLGQRTYAEATNISIRSVVDHINDHSQPGNEDCPVIIADIEKMTPTEQERYRTDADFRKNLDNLVTRTLRDNPVINGQGIVIQPGHGDTYLASARSLLMQVADGKQPKEDVLSKLRHLYSTKDPESVNKALNMIEKTFKEEPDLRLKINNPKTAEDKAYAEYFKEAVRNATGSHYDSLIKPLLETGHTPLESRLPLHDGIINDDLESIYADINQSVTSEQRRKLNNDSEFEKQFTEQYLSFLNKEQQEIILASVKQGEMKPEDKIRACLIGWGGSSTIVEELEKIKPNPRAKPEDIANFQAEIVRCRNQYASKYGGSLDEHLHKKLNEEDHKRAQRVLSTGLSRPVRANMARDELQTTLSGMGTWMNQNIFGSATEAQALATNDKLVQAVTHLNALISGMSPIAQRQMAEAAIDKAITMVQQARDTEAGSKRAVGENIAMGATAAAGIFSLIATGGTDAPLLFALTAASTGASAKIGSNMLMQGTDYDKSLGNVLTQGITGAVESIVSGWGPEQAAAALGIGKSMAKEATALAIADLGDGASAAISQSVLEQGITTVVQRTFVSHAAEVDARLLARAVDRAIASEIVGEARQAMIVRVTEHLLPAANDNLAKIPGRTIMRHTLNAAGGAAGGAIVGMAGGAAEWDPKKTVNENVNQMMSRIAVGTTFGSAGGLALSFAIGGIGTVVKKVFKGTSQLAPGGAASGHQPLIGRASTAATEPTSLSATAGKITHGPTGHRMPISTNKAAGVEPRTDGIAKTSTSGSAPGTDQSVLSIYGRNTPSGTRYMLSPDDPQGVGNPFQKAENRFPTTGEGVSGASASGDPSVANAGSGRARAADPK